MADIIKVEQLTYRYSQADQLALDHVSFSVAAGEWIAIVGHNGSGKSTLVRAIDGLIGYEEGSITVAGTELSPESVWLVREHIGMVFQNPDNQFVGATVADDVAFGLENASVPRTEMQERVKAALSEVDMLDFADREPSRLSGGQKQRVALAGIIAMNPSIIVLDEATSMLDPHGRQTVLAVLTKLRKAGQAPTIISITHDLAEAAQAQRLLVMNDGKLITQGTPTTIFSNDALLQATGLDEPFTTKLSRALAQRQLASPTGYLTDDEMEDWLWQSHSTM
ncbi:energy-coupling factor ABC transporter ATP-binding protein [Furfurilactobacillus curtus]|uniref:Energy-coupling factor transporter ATP-binding protein EcfA1 n=1 Tax=Furfurilactobacillus curtus TaxID=1746200 RepID=A0ABQ5JPJ0_9LACO